MLPRPSLRARELFAMILLLIGIKMSDMTPALLAQETKNAFWMVPILSFLVILPSLLLLLHVIKQYEDKNFVQLLKHLFGNVVGGSIGLLIFFIAFIALAIDSRSTIDVLGTVYFQESPTVILYAIFMLVCYFGARKGFNVIGTTAFLILPYVKLALLFLMLLILKETVFLRIFPLFGDGFTPLIFESISKASIYGELFILPLAYTSFKQREDFHKGMLWGSVVSVTELTLFFLLYCTLFDYKSIDKNAFLFHEVTQFITLGNYLSNIETFFMAFWLIGTFIRFIIYLYMIAWLFGEVFTIKKFKSFLLPFSYLAIVIGIIPENPMVNVLIIRDQFLTLITPLFIFLPFCLWIAYKWKGDTK
ncbi:GerAB/ArcD/ProY family transporter [Metabacillus sp. HB246100]